MIRPGPVETNARHQFAKKREKCKGAKATQPRGTLLENRALKSIPQKLHLGTKPLRYFFYRHFSLVIIILCKKTNLGFSCKPDSPL
jgi:hypothetical protein